MWRGELNKLILSSSAVSEGSWEKVSHLERPFTISVYGFAAGDVAQIYVANLAAQPAAAAPAAGDGSFKLGGDISADTGVEVSGTWRWIRVRKSAAGGAPATTKAEIDGIARWALPA